MRSIILQVIISCYFLILPFNQVYADNNPDYNQLRIHSINIPTQYFLSSSEKSLQHLLKQHDLFTSQDQLKKIVPGKFVYAKIDFQDIELIDSIEYVLYFGAFSELKLFKKDDQVTLGGNLRPMNEFRSFMKSHYFQFQKKDLIDGRYLYGVGYHYIRYTAQLRTIIHAQVVQDFYANNFNLDFIEAQIPVFLFIGGIFMLMLFISALYFLQKEKVFLHYATYLFFILLYLGRKYSYVTEVTFTEAPILGYYYNEIIQLLANYFYLRFALTFLSAKTNYPKFYTAARVMQGIYLICILLSVVFISFYRYENWQYHMMNLQRYLSAVFVIASIIYLLKVKVDNILYFMAAGSFIYIIGAMSALFAGSVRFMMAGAIMEAFIFALGIGYKLKMSEKEKRDIRDDLIEQLRINEELVQAHNEKLQIEVKHRSEKIIQQKMALEHAQTEQMKAELEREVDQMKMVALRAQMNPHFLFNCLNSIRAMIIRNDVKEASYYLSRFSKLMRQVLDYSAMNIISLKQEIELSQLYIELENIRFNHELHYQVDLSSNIDTDKYAIPPLLLQPYLENAIWHGLSQKEGIKKVSLSIQDKPNHIKLIISDNGVGRKKASSKKGNEHTSKAMNITLNRLKLFTSENDSLIKNPIEIIDLKDSIGSPKGTSVIIFLIKKNTSHETQNDHH